MAIQSPQLLLDFSILCFSLNSGVKLGVVDFSVAEHHYLFLYLNMSVSPLELDCCF